jgi:biopolymer transport protein ExbB
MDVNMMLFADSGDLWHSGALGYMIEGGPFMWPILLLAIIGLAVVIERFRALRIITSDTTAVRAKVLDLLHADRVDEALAVCAESRGPVPAILSVGIHRYEQLRRLNYDPARIDEHVNKAMEDYGVHITAALERYLPVLSTVATVAPMLGSLGTVVGMVLMFQDVVNKFGTENIILAAAAGIKVKLIVTVFGLMVGIPAFVAFNYYQAVVRRYILEAEETASQLIEALSPRLADAADRVQAGGSV